MPVAIASTFFTAPPTSTPTGSVAGVDAQRRRRGRPRPAASRSAGVGAGRDQRRRLAARHLEREARARRARRRARRGAQLRARPRGRARPLPASKPLHSHSHRRGRVGRRRSMLAQRRPSAWRRRPARRAHGATAASKSLARRCSAGGSADSGQVARVARAATRIGCGLRRRRAPTARVACARRGVDGQRRAPGAGAEHGEVHRRGRGVGRRRSAALTMPAAPPLACAAGLRPAAALVHRLEVDFGQMHRREAGAGADVGHDGAQVRDRRSAGRRCR